MKRNKRHVKNRRKKAAREQLEKEIDYFLKRRHEERRFKKLMQKVIET